MRILLADAEECVRSALRLILEEDERLEIVGETGCRRDLDCQIRRFEPDLLLVDWDLMEGGVAGLRRNHPGLKIAVMSSRMEARTAAEAEGVDAFVCKGQPPERALNILMQIAKG